MEIDTGRWNTRLKKRSVGFLLFFCFFHLLLKRVLFFLIIFVFCFLFLFLCIYIYISVAF